MARKTRVNKITDPETLAKVNPDNKRLLDDFLDYLKSTQRSPSTIAVYKNDMEIAWVWGLKYNRDKFFVDWTKRDIMSFQNYLVNENQNSPARVRRIKATLSSLSKFIESILDDEYPRFRNIVHKVESPVLQPVREKTVLSEQQLDDLLNYLVQKKDFEKACMVALAMCSGRRKAELVLFKVAYFTDECIVAGSLYRTPEKIKTKGRGNGKYIHCYTLAHRFRPYLDMWMNYRQEHGIESEWLFPSKSDPSQPISVSLLNSWAKMISNYLDVSFYWHSLRHYTTTYLAKAGIPDSVIAQLFAWESVDMVSVYNDTTIDESLDKYFNADGIVSGATKSVAELA